MRNFPEFPRHLRPEAFRKSFRVYAASALRGLLAQGYSPPDAVKSATNIAKAMVLAECDTLFAEDPPPRDPGF